MNKKTSSIKHLEQARQLAAATPRPWRAHELQAVEQLRDAPPDAVINTAAATGRDARRIAFAARWEGPRAWRRFACRPRPLLNSCLQVAEIAQQRLPGHPVVDELWWAVCDLARAIDEVSAGVYSRQEMAKILAYAASQPMARRRHN